jgi:pyruvate/2-oxoglutarate dehydrogenase complex dihydrolipoamide dehydrogenase (E3) component
LIRRASEFGIETGEPRLDWAAAVDRAQAIVAGCADPKPEQLTSHGVELVFGQARFTGPHTIAVGERVLEGMSIVVATGAVLPRLSVEGIELADSHVEFLAMRELPSRVVVIGGGVIGMEFAFLLARAGVKVAVVELFDHVLGRVDGDVRDAVAAAAAALGIELHLSTGVERLTRGDGGLVVEGRAPGGAVRLEADRVLLAAGMVPAVDGLELEQAGVAYDRHGIPTDQTLRTNVSHIFAAGDVRAGSYQLSPVATRQGMIAAGNALQGGQEAFEDRVVPYLVGLTPPAAGVGLSEEQAREQGIDMVVHRQDYEGVCPVGNVEGEPEGFVKVMAEAAGGRILGAHAVGAGSPELIQQVAFAMLGNLTLKQAAGALFVFPGLSQALQHALAPEPIHDPAYNPAVHAIRPGGAGRAAGESLIGSQQQPPSAADSGTASD